MLFVTLKYDFIPTSSVLRREVNLDRRVKQYKRKSNSAKSVACPRSVVTELFYAMENNLARFEVKKFNWCHSVSQLVKVDFVWSIHHFKLEDHLSDRYIFRSATNHFQLNSSVFSLEKTSKTKFYLILVVDSNGISLGLNTDDQVERYVEHTMQLKFSILNKENKKVFSTEEKCVHKDDKLPFKMVLCERNGVDNFLVDGNLTIHCDILSSVSKETFSGIHGNSHSFDNAEKLVENLEELLKNKTFSDVTIDVNGRQFQVHKNILAARSPVFAAMFGHETAENLSGIVNVSDVEPEVFEELLHFIYTGRVSTERWQEMAARLLIAADKYLLRNLVLECENFLIEEMSGENCTELLSLAENYSLKNMKQSALDFIRRWPAEVVATNSWKKAKRDNPVWSCAVMEEAFIPPTALVDN